MPKSKKKQSSLEIISEEKIVTIPKESKSNKQPTNLPTTKPKLKES